VTSALRPHIARGRSGDCCTLCGRVRVKLPGDHGCAPNLPPADMDQLLRAQEAYDRGERRPPWGDLFKKWDRPKPAGLSLPQYTAAKGTPEARLLGLLRTVHSAPLRQRNTVLHWAACRVGEMLAADELPDAVRAADSLASVGIGIGLTPQEVPGTIASGFAKSGVRL